MCRFNYRNRYHTRRNLKQVEIHRNRPLPISFLLCKRIFLNFLLPCDMSSTSQLFFSNEVIIWVIPSASIQTDTSQAAQRNETLEVGRLKVVVVVCVCVIAKESANDGRGSRRGGTRHCRKTKWRGDGEGEGGNRQTGSGLWALGSGCGLGRFQV